MGGIEVGFVEREATSQSLMKLSIQLHLADLSLLDTICVLELFGVDRVTSTVHNWVHKADLRLADGHSPDHVAVDEIVLQLDDERYWLSAAVDPETNELLHTKLESIRTNVLAHAFLSGLREEHDVPRIRRFLVCRRDAVGLVNAVFLLGGATPLKDACNRHVLDFRYERHGNRDSVERVFREVKRRTTAFSDCFSPPRKLLTSGFDRSPSHGVNYSSVCK